MALVLKFLVNYLFRPAAYPAIPRRDDPADDVFFFRQGPAKGLGKVRFHDWRLAFDGVDLPNVRIFVEQVEALKRLLVEAPPDEAQQQDVDLQLSLGEVFTLVPYGQLILEEAPMEGASGDLVDQIFDVMVRDLSRYALQLAHKPSTTPEQQQRALAMIRKPAADPERFRRVWENEVYALADAYEMAE